MSEAEPAAPGAGTNNRWRLDSHIALVTGASAGLGAGFPAYFTPQALTSSPPPAAPNVLEELAQHCGNQMQTIAGESPTRITGRLSSDAAPARPTRRTGEQRRHLRRRAAGAAGPGRPAAGGRGQPDQRDGPVPADRRPPAGRARGQRDQRRVDVRHRRLPQPDGRLQATKAALINLTRHLAAVWGQDGVRVNALAPGYFLTELTGILADPAFAQSIRDRTLLGRTSELDELDGPLLFLATDASSYMTGQALVIDGGWTAV